MVPILSLLLALSPAHPIVDGEIGKPVSERIAGSLPAERQTSPAKGASPAHQPARISLRANDSGVVRVRLALAPNGTPTACTVVKSVAPELDRATCEGIMDRARFEPAPDGERGALFAERAVTWWR
ncbi:TonB family protein [Sphingomonas sp.]|uniref:TonB family protein n=1 Tax=Sphingomonas sp. TaxID=28214 RepID=UPI000DB0AC91|nr:TonB family protein [Sphingomonas sp.]PZU11773.1 MAG: hypothetical protein DI605_02030 [Sphingomonas sp.]